MLRNQFSGGEFVRQGKRLAFTVGVSPTFFGFFPGVGPLMRIRHSLSPLIGYQYAPGAKVPDEYARALDPTGRILNARSDPQQTISLGLSQNFEAKLKPPPGDMAAAGKEPRKIRLISINTSAISYNFEQAKQPGRVGWQTQTLSNTLASDLLPGFSLQISHDLWRGQVGLDTTRFDPFLQSVSTSFAIGPGTLQAIAGLLGFRGQPDPVPAPTPADTTGQLGPRSDAFRRYQGGSRDAFGGMYGAPGGRAFSLNVQYSSSRSRTDPSAGRSLGGRQMANFNLGCRPTRNWSATGTTSYDFDTRQFAQHFVRFERDLRRWHASFVFAKSGNGNFSFSFNIALSDQPDIKFDYDQRTFVRP